MPELPEGTINAFIQNKNLAKYGLLKDNEGGFLAENFVVRTCVEINRCVGCTRQFFTKSILGDDAALLARSSGEEPASPRRRAGVASMAWWSTRRFSANAP